TQRKTAVNYFFLSSEEIWHCCENDADDDEHGGVRHEVGIDHQHDTAHERNHTALPPAVDEIPEPDRAEEDTPEKLGLVHSRTLADVAGDRISVRGNFLRTGVQFAGARRVACAPVARREASASISQGTS